MPLLRRWGRQHLPGATHQINSSEWSSEQLLGHRRLGRQLRGISYSVECVVFGKLFKHCANFKEYRDNQPLLIDGCERGHCGRVLRRHQSGTIHISNIEGYNSLHNIAPPLPRTSWSRAIETFIDRVIQARIDCDCIHPWWRPAEPRSQKLQHQSIWALECHIVQGDNRQLYL